MHMTNITYCKMKCFAPVLPFIRNFRTRLRQCATTISTASGLNQELPLKAEDNDKSDLQNVRRKFALLFSKRRSDFRGFYSFVIDDSVAGMIAEEVMKSHKAINEATVIEIHPGMGKITRHLIQRGIKKVILCDLRKCFWSEELLQEYKENIIVHYYKDWISKLTALDQILPEYLLQQQSQPLIIILVNVNRLFIRNLMENIVLVDNSLLANGVLYLAVSQPIISVFQDSSGRTAELLDYGFIDIIFDMEILAEFPRSAVLPPTKLKGVDKLYLISLKRKTVPLISEKNWVIYWNFVNILSKRKHAPVIASLEKWAPGCGPLLIADGLSVFTKISELSKSDVLYIFETLLADTDYRFALKILEEDISLKNRHR